jgi:signal transduction histidine kinase
MEPSKPVIASRPVKARPHPNEAERLRALRSYGILDTATEPAYDDITRIASYVCQTPVAVVSLVDENRQWFKSEIGLGVRESSLETSICAHAILEHDFLFEVSDTTGDPRFASNPVVTGPEKIRFYAGALLRTPDGLPLGTLCVTDHKPRRLTSEQRDVLTALARQVMAQLELRRALAASDRMRQNVSRMMAITGHDLKQPLQIMMMAIDRIKKKLTDPRDQERFRYAVDASKQMAEDLDRLAETSALEGGFGAPDLKTFAVAEIFDTVVYNWRLHAEIKGLRLVFKPCSAYVVSDLHMLRAIVGNLVGNAIKYTERGRVVVGCRRRGKFLSIEILDSGVGIPPHQLPTIFDAFHQINPANEGLGLGLSIVRRTTDALGHKISVKSKLGRGSHFSIEVPLAPVERL